MIKVELRKWEIIRIISLLDDEIEDEKDLLNNGPDREYDNMLKERIETGNDLINRLKKSLEV